MIIGMTSLWYQKVLEIIPPNSKILDVGIGTGAALIKNGKILQEKNLSVIGIDIDADYLVKCRNLIEEANLSTRVGCILASATDYKGGPYDAIYFSGSFMIIPSDLRSKMLTNMKNIMSSSNSRFYFTQTFQEKRSFFMEYLKPLLAYFTTIDFGKVTYEAEFIRVVEEAGLEIEKMEKISQHMGRSARLVVAKIK
mmetsp:Transcript_24557/g.32072  ORF Transcript_24557/g.32072 Transcript_24557/m.32072 type:complete len:196 (+) Transcript_24557:288-875(+)